MTGFKDVNVCVGSSWINLPILITEPGIHALTVEKKWTCRFESWSNTRNTIPSSFLTGFPFPTYSPWKFNSEFTPENKPSQKGKQSSNHQFSGAMFNFGGVFSLLRITRYGTTFPPRYVGRCISEPKWSLIYLHSFSQKGGLGGFFSGWLVVVKKKKVSTNISKQPMP